MQMNELIYFYLAGLIHNAFTSA